MKAIFYYGIFCMLYNNVYNIKPPKFQRLDVEKFEVNASLLGRRSGGGSAEMTDEDYKLLDNRAKGITLSCISCNNVETRACSNPKSKIVNTEKCKEPGDRCLSLHTPFGIVRRSCYNMHSKQLLYFCVCDLCNDININALGTMLFTNKREWIDSVAEHTHFLRMRHTTKSHLKCVYCYRHNYSDTDEFRDQYCETGTPYLRIRTCGNNEVCGIRIVKETGFILRGCVGGPLYNYYYNFCDTNNCNDDPVVSVYDPV